MELDVTKISGKNGIKNITEKLDTLYKKDRAKVTFDAFERFQRPQEMAMKDFIIEFEIFLAETKSYGTTMSEDILSY